MEQKHNGAREADNNDREQQKDAPTPRSRRDHDEAVPEFERGSDLDREQDERQSQR